MKEWAGAIVLGLLLIAAFTAGALTAPDSPEEILQDSAGVEVFLGGEVPDLSFINEYGDAVSLAELKGRWTLMFFGYTYCPDICPMTLVDLKKMYRQLSEAERQQVNIVLVSVDPERDLPKNLTPYMDYFHEDFTALTGNAQSLRTLASKLNAFYAKAEREGSAYLLDHSANLVLLDRELNYRGYIEPPHDPDRMMPLLRAALRLP